MEKQLDIEIGRELFHLLFKKSDRRLFALMEKELLNYRTNSTESGCRVEVIPYSHHQKFIWSPSELERFRRFFSIIYSRCPINGQIEEAVELSLKILQSLNPREERIRHINSCINESQTLIFSMVESDLYFFDTKSNIASFFIKEETGLFHKIIGILKGPKKIGSRMVMGVMNGLMFVLSYQLICHRGLLLHGAAVQKNDKAVLFLGLSGAGKSTISRLCGPDACFSDDGVIVRKEGTHIYAYRSPFRQMKRNEKCPELMKGKIKKLFLLEKDKQHNIISLKRNELMNIILLNLIHFFKFMNDETARKGFSVVKEIVDMLPAYRLHFTKTQYTWDDIW